MTFFYPILDALNSGRIVRRFVALALRILAVTLAVFGIVAVVFILKLSFSAQSPMEVSIAGLLLACSVLFAIACVVQILFYRAHGISELKDSEYTVVPIASMLLRATGEVLATWVGLAGFGGFFVFLLAAQWAGQFREILPMTSIYRPFFSSPFGAFAYLVFTIVGALGLLIVFYFFAELTHVTVDIAHTLHLMRLEGGFVRGPGRLPIPAIEESKCPRCGTAVEFGNAFCVSCGTRVAGEPA